MPTQLEHAHLLNKLHIKGDPLILFNIWDAGSAHAIEDIGVKVLGTSSWAVAESHGYQDGEKLLFDLVLANLKRIIARVNLPVTIDLEGGYGQALHEIQVTTLKIIEAGAVGINFEDQIIGTGELYSIKDQYTRIKALREAAEQTSIPLFINARTDIFLKSDSIHHNEKQLKEAIQRAKEYADAGANGFFAPGLRDPRLIELLCQLSPIPINIMIMADTPPPRGLASLGVARISYGPSPYCQIMEALKEAGRKVLISSKF